jgi:hypothetical protein
MEKPILGGNIKNDSLLVRLGEKLADLVKKIYDWSRRNKGAAILLTIVKFGISAYGI